LFAGWKYIYVEKEMIVQVSDVLHTWGMDAAEMNRVQKHFFTHRVVDPWNLLPADIVGADTVDSFRRLMRAVPTGENGSTTK
jgi:hypothetical protein